MLLWWLVCSLSWTFRATAVAIVKGDGNVTHKTLGKGNGKGDTKVVLAATSVGALIRRDVSAPPKQQEQPKYVSFNHPKWIGSCRHIYLDVGSHMGVQVRKFFQPEKYEDAPVLPLFDSHFGLPAKRALPGKKSGMCVLGLEPNPLNQPHLDVLSKIYEEKGWHAHFYPFAAWRAEGFQRFNSIAGDPTDTRGAHLVFDNDAEGQLDRVRTVDLSSFIRSLPHNTVKMMKMDIGGAEYGTLAQLIDAKMLCTGIIDFACINPHPEGNWSGTFWKGEETFAGIKSAVNTLKCYTQKNTALVQMSDESYYEDNMRPKWFSLQGHAFLRLLLIVLLLGGMTCYFIRSGKFGETADRWVDKQWASFIGSKG